MAFSCGSALCRGSSLHACVSRQSSSSLENHPKSSQIFLKSPEPQKPDCFKRFSVSFWGKSLNIKPVHAASCSETKDASFFQVTMAKVIGGAQGRCIRGKCFVVGDNIDTDQIIPAEYLTLVPSKPEEYEKLGSYAFIGLPSGYGRFVEDGRTKAEYSVVVAGDNFGCGSSREHAPVALGAAGIQAVVAPSYARIFFRNSVSTGELYPVESAVRLSDECRTGDLVTVDLENHVFINDSSGKQYALKPIGDAGPVVDAGGLFAYARKTGMIAAST